MITHRLRKIVKTTAITVEGRFAKCKSCESKKSQIVQKIIAKFTLRKEIKADSRKQHALSVNNLVGDVKANPKDFYRCINSQIKTSKVFPL